MRVQKLLLLLLLFCLFIPTSAVLGQESSPPADPLTVFFAEYEAINAGDLEGALALFGANSVKVASPPPPNTSGIYQGIEGIQGLEAYLIGNNAHITFVETQVRGNVITFRAHLTEDLFRMVGIYPIEFTGSAIVQNGVILTETWLMNERDAAMLDAALAENGNKALLDRFYQEIWTEGKLEVIEEIISDEFIDHFTGETGREPLRNIVQLFHTAFPDLVVTYDNVVADGGLIVAEVSFTGTYAGGMGEIFGVPDSAIGKEITLTGIDYARIVNGQYVEGWGTHDELGWLTQFGLELQVTE